MNSDSFLRELHTLCARYGADSKAMQRGEVHATNTLIASTGFGYFVAMFLASGTKVNRLVSEVEAAGSQLDKMRGIQ